MCPEAQQSALLLASYAFIVCSVFICHFQPNYESCAIPNLTLLLSTDSLLRMESDFRDSTSNYHSNAFLLISLLFSNQPFAALMPLLDFVHVQRAPVMMQTLHILEIIRSISVDYRPTVIDAISAPVMSNRLLKIVKAQSTFSGTVSCEGRNRVLLSR